jgi:hypothetical protein
MIPRSYVIIRVANTKAQTASIGNVIEFGGQDHASPVWNEVFCLSAETFASCTLKVYTATQNHITDAVFHHQIGRCVFALDSLPFCDECLNEDCSGFIVTNFASVPILNFGSLHRRRKKCRQSRA